MQSDGDQPSDLNTRKAWSDDNVRDLQAAIKSGCLLDAIVVYLCRTEQDVREKAAELGLPLNE